MSRHLHGNTTTGEKLCLHVCVTWFPCCTVEKRKERNKTQCLACDKHLINLSYYFWLSTYHVSGTILSPLQKLFHLILSAALWGRYCYLNRLLKKQCEACCSYYHLFLSGRSRTSMKIFAAPEDRPESLCNVAESWLCVRPTMLQSKRVCTGEP